jgi:hypothetical protein
MTDDMPWAEVCETDRVPHFTTSRVGVVVRLSGSCPRCRHPTTTNFTRVIPSQAGLRAGAQPVTLYCQCGVAHPGHPDNEDGCGAYWNVVTVI